MTNIINKCNSVNISVLNNTSGYLDVVPQKLNQALNYNSYEKKQFIFINASKTQRKIFELLLQHTNYETGIIYITQTTIVNKLGCHRKTVKRAFDMFTEIGLMSRNRQQSRGTNGEWGYCENRLNIDGLTVGHFMYHKIESKDSINNKSNYKEELPTKNKSKEKQQVSFENEKHQKNIKPFDEIDPDTFYPSGKAEKVLDQTTPYVSQDLYIPEIRQDLKQYEKFLGRKLQRYEANYRAIFSIKKTKKYRDMYGDRYIPLYKRQQFNDLTMKSDLKKINYELSQQAIMGFSREELLYYQQLKYDKLLN